MSDFSQSESVNITLMGQEFRLRTTENPDFIQKLSELVNSRIEEIRLSTDIVDSSRIVLMASLSLAEDYLSTKDELEKLQNEIKEKSDGLVKKIEEC
jgi:cell division protein ZapA (FtsZ GTPase activity inhibitor)